MELQREQSLPLKASLIHMAAGYLLSLQLQCATSHFRRFSDGGLYGTRCIEFLVGSKVNKGFMIVYSLVAIVGATINLGLLWSVAETFNGMMVIPNLIGLFLLSGTVVKLVKENNEKHKKLKG